MQDVDEPLTGVALAALDVGVLLLLVGHPAFRCRVADVSRSRLVAAGAVAGASAVGAQLSALWSLVTLAVVLAALVTRESVGSGR